MLSNEGRMNNDLAPRSGSELLESQPTRINGKRCSIALVCWFFSSAGVFLSFIAGLAFFWHSLVNEPLLDAFQNRELYVGLSFVFPWTALAVMTIAWVRNKQVSRLWPLVGGLIGILYAVAFKEFLLGYITCIPLGFYLCYFHLAGRTAGGTRTEPLSRRTAFW